MKSPKEEDLAYMYRKHIINNHEMPEQIISERDKWLTSNFWKSMMKQLGTKHKLSTAYQAQINRGDERLH